MRDKGKGSIDLLAVIVSLISVTLDYGYWYRDEGWNIRALRHDGCDTIPEMLTPVEFTVTDTPRAAPRLMTLVSTSESLRSRSCRVISPQRWRHFRKIS
jgi:hypothetical protein